MLEELGRRGYAPSPGDVSGFPIGRPDRETFPMTAADGSAVVVKVYPGALGETAFRNMTRLWSSPFGQSRRPPGLPEPAEYVPLPGVGGGALVMERLEGRTLLELGTPEEHLESAMRLAVDLHRSGAIAPRLRSAKKLVRSVRRKAERVAALEPRYGTDLTRVAEALEAKRPRDAELVPCHGDFSPRNVLVGPARQSLIDWDRFQRADPARDVAYFGAWCWAQGLRSGRDDWRILDRVVRIYGVLRPDADLAPRLGFHVAAGLARIAHGLVELWPEQAHLVPRLAAEALRRLS